MKRKRMAILFIFITLMLPVFRAWSLDIYLNGNYWKQYTNEELSILTGAGGSIPFWHLCPIMEDITQLEIMSAKAPVILDNASVRNNFYSSDVSVTDSVLIVKFGNLVIQEPKRIFISGKISGVKKITIWSEQDDSWLKKELDIFSGLQNIEISLEIHPDIDDYIYTADGTGPDIVVFSEESYISLAEDLSPLIIETTEFPPVLLEQYRTDDLQLSVPLYLSCPVLIVPKNSSLRNTIKNRENFYEYGKGNNSGTVYMDLYAFSLFYSIMESYETDGSSGSLPLRSEEIKKTMNTILTLKPFVIKITDNNISDFPGNSPNDIIYLSSRNIVGLKKNKKDFEIESVTLLKINGKSLMPLLSPTMIAVPSGTNSKLAANRLIRYLTDNIPQEEIDISKGYFPVNISVISNYPFLKDSVENGILLPSDSMFFQFRETYDSLGRLTVNGQLGVDEFTKKMIILTTPRE